MLEPRKHRKIILLIAWWGAFLAIFATVILNSYRLASKWEAEEIRALILLDGGGQPWDVSRLGDSIALVYFGYTFCPDVCPTTLSILAAEAETWREKGRNVVALFITVDPDRDTPAAVKAYAASFGDAVIGISGTTAQIERAMETFGVTAVRDGQGDQYLIDHSTKVFALNGNGTNILLLFDDDYDKLPKIMETTVFAELTRDGILD